MRYILAFLALTLVASAESRWVDVLHEMRDASVVAVVRIVSYDHARLHCVAGDRTLALKCSPDGTWIPDRTVHDLNSIQTGEWPAVGCKVLVVSDRDNVVSVFARPSGSDWRFWSPWMTGSEAFFRYESPLKPIPGATVDNGCWGGCLLPRSALQPYLK